MSFQEFFTAYLEAAAWTKIGPDLEPEELDAAQEGFDAWKIDPDNIADCQVFYDTHNHLFTDENCTYAGCSPTAYAGHDYWLTRNGHGCGFWDGDWKEPAATVLTEASQHREVWF